MPQSIIPLHCNSQHSCSKGSCATNVKNPIKRQWGKPQCKPFCYNPSASFLMFLITNLFQDVINYAYQKIAQKTSKKLPRQYLCTERNVSMCDISENNKQVSYLTLGITGFKLFQMMQLLHLFNHCP